MYAGVDTFKKYMTEAGFGDLQATKCHSCFMKEDNSQNPRALFDPSVRQSDSNFTFYTEKEIEDAMNNLRDILEVYGEEHFKQLFRKENELYGTSTEISGIKQ